MILCTIVHHGRYYFLNNEIIFLFIIKLKSDKVFQRYPTAHDTNEHYLVFLEENNDRSVIFTILPKIWDNELINVGFEKHNIFQSRWCL